MFDGLTERLGQTVRNLRGVGRLTEDNIKDTLRDVRMALLEADVALPVVKQFIDQVREKALGEIKRPAFFTALRVSSFVNLISNILTLKPRSISIDVRYSTPKFS